MVHAVGAARDQVGEAGAVGDVRGGVLVEERVQERDPGPADGRRPVDERDLAEPARALVRLELGPDGVLAGGRTELDDLAVAEAKLQVADDRPRQAEGPRRPDDAVRPPPVRAREDLLGGEVRHVPEPPLGLGLGRLPERAGQEPDGEVRPIAVEADRVEAALREQVRPLGEAIDVPPPGLDRIGLVEANRAGNRIPQALDVGLAEDRLGPALVGICRHHPRYAPLGGDAKHVVVVLRHPGRADAPLVELREERRFGLAGDRDARTPPLDEVLEPRHPVRRRPRERLLGPELDERLADVVVLVQDVDVARAGLVGRARQGARERRVLDEAADLDILARLQVQADADDQARVGLEALVSHHGGEA